MADSPAVTYEPTCHPGTREVVTGRIMAWARDPKAEPILWLSGPAGAGKSCIQRTIVQYCIAEGLFIACFFFSIKQSERNSQTRFVTTLAAQLAENISGLKKHINSAIEMDQRIFTRSLESQVDGLIFKPLRALQGSTLQRLKAFFNTAFKAFLRAFCYQGHEKTRANVIVIDGLDECVGEKEQARILSLIHALATNSHFPFRIIIASRPEYAIRTAFFSPSLSKDTLIFRLEQYEADGDLMLFLEAEFSHLKLVHSTSKSIPADWPSPKDENALVTKASRQFIYVSVVMKHLANPRRNPMVELRRILDYQPSRYDTNPFAELDALYNRILHPPDIDTSLLTSILHLIIHDKPRETMSPVDDLDMLFGLRPGTTSSTLVDLHSLLNFNSPDRRPTFHHKSLEDFLTTAARAGDLYQSNDQTHVQLTVAYYNLGRQHQLQNRGTATSDHVWDLTLLTTSHACSVSDWSLFEREFAENTLPAFIDSLVQNDIMAVTVLMERRRLDPYVHRYHSFFVSLGSSIIRASSRAQTHDLLLVHHL
jgi:hypothetical protein